MIKQITKTDWGVEVVMNDNAILDDTTILPTTMFILDKCKEFKKDKVLVDERTITRKVSTFKLLDVAELIRKECGGLKMAFIAPHLVNHADSRAFDNFAFNRGVSIRYFADRDTALDWLLK